MSLYTYGQKWGIIAANLMRKLWAAIAAPDSPGAGEIWLDISATPYLLKRYNGSTWDIIGQTYTIPVKCTGAEIDTGTDDAKFATPKAIEDSDYIKAAAINQAAVTGLHTTDGPTFDHIHLTSGQIGFPATQVSSADANTLDDYEEGTWTPGISIGSGTTGITYSSQTGYYTKIGNVVTVRGRIALTAKGSLTGIIYITGLPFTVANNPPTQTVPTLLIYNATFANQFSGLATVNTTTVILYEVTEAGAITGLANTDLTDTSNFTITMSYMAA